jgi:hypothetical protein
MKNRAKIFAAILVCTAGFWSIAAADNDPAVRAAIELNSHSTVLINRTAAEIWPHIADPSTWKQGGQLLHHSGPEGAGGIFKAISPTDGSVMFFIKNVEFIPYQRRTIKLYMPSNGPLIGYAAWTLDEEDGQTEVSYHVYTETLLPPEQSASSTAEELAEFEAINYETNKARFDRELEALKDMVEAGDR